MGRVNSEHGYVPSLSRLLIRFFVFVEFADDAADALAFEAGEVGKVRPFLDEVAVCVDGVRFG